MDDGVAHVLNEDYALLNRQNSILPYRIYRNRLQAKAWAKLRKKTIYNYVFVGKASRICIVNHTEHCPTNYKKM